MFILTVSRDIIFSDRPFVIISIYYNGLPLLCLSLEMCTGFISAWGAYKVRLIDSNIPDPRRNVAPTVVELR